MGNRKLAFLLGAGVSLPAGYPTTQEITKEVLSGEYYLETDGIFYPGQIPYEGHMRSDYVPKIQGVLNALKLEIENFYNRDINYEDLYYVVSQIFDSESGEFENPIVPAFVNKIDDPVLDLIEDSFKERNEQLFRTFSYTETYIRHVIWHLLIKSKNDYWVLDSVLDGCEDEKVIDIFTLNHDLLVENALSERKIDFVDGFGYPVNNVRHWEPEVYENSKNKINLYKLHGSVNWYKVIHWKPERGVDFVIPLDGDHWHMMSPSGNLQHSLPDRPLILAGTFNKMLQYTSGIFAEMFFQFYSAIKDVNRIVVSGYSFSDKGINATLVDWIFSSSDKKLIIIHDDPDELVSTARGVIKNNWEDWRKQGKIKLIEKWIEKTSWNEIKKKISED